MGKDNRVEYIDLAKGICIILVVFFHYCQFYEILDNGEESSLLYYKINCFISVFMVPLFFFVSGCFFKDHEGIYSFIKRKINRLLIPFVFFYIFFSFLLPQIFRFFGIYVYFYKPLNKIFTSFLYDYYPCVPIWFLLCLFEVNIIFYFILKILKNNIYLLELLSFIIGFVGVFLGIKRINLPAYIDTAFTTLPYFAIGYYVYNKTKHLQINKYNRKFPLFIILFLSIIGIIMPKTDLFNNRFYEQDWITMYPCAFLGIFSIIMIARLFNNLPVLSYYGRYSVILLVTHTTIYEILAIFISRSSFSTTSQLFINLFLTLASYYLIIPFTRRYFPYVTAQKDLI